MSSGMGSDSTDAMLNSSDWCAHFLFVSSCVVPSPLSCTSMSTLFNSKSEIGACRFPCPTSTKELRSLFTTRMKNINKPYNLNSTTAIHTCKADISVRICTPVKRVSSCSRCRLSTNITTRYNSKRTTKRESMTWAFSNTYTLQLKFQSMQKNPTCILCV